MITPEFSDGSAYCCTLSGGAITVMARLDEFAQLWRWSVYHTVRHAGTQLLAIGEHRDRDEACTLAIKVALPASEALTRLEGHTHDTPRIARRGEVWRVIVGAEYWCGTSLDSLVDSIIRHTSGRVA